MTFRPSKILRQPHQDVLLKEIKVFSFSFPIPIQGVQQVQQVLIQVSFDVKIKIEKPFKERLK